MLRHPYRVRLDITTLVNGNAENQFGLFITGAQQIEYQFTEGLFKIMEFT
jgi:hypothetical protein